MSEEQAGQYNPAQDYFDRYGDWFHHYSAEVVNEARDFYTELLRTNIPQEAAPKAWTYAQGASRFMQKEGAAAGRAMGNTVGGEVIGDGDSLTMIADELMRGINEVEVGNQAQAAALLRVLRMRIMKHAAKSLPSTVQQSRVSLQRCPTMTMTITNEQLQERGEEKAKQQGSNTEPWTHGYEKATIEHLTIHRDTLAVLEKLRKPMMRYADERRFNNLTSQHMEATTAITELDSTIARLNEVLGVK